MKMTSTSISSLFKSQVKILERDEPYFKSTFHYHPEFELVYIIEGFGKRIIGNKVDNFQKGEILLVGPNVPHMWMSDKSFYAHGSNKRSKAIVIYFNPKIFSDTFYEMDESSLLRKLFNKAEQGIVVNGKARKQITAKLRKILSLKGFDKILWLFDILNFISKTNEVKYINQNNFINPSSSDRLKHLFDFINENYKRNIHLKEVAEFMSLTPGSFCRFFKQKTGKKFVDYLQETRISHACQLLLNTDLTVAEVAYKTGFKTASYFNKLFKEHTNYSPTKYRSSLTEY